MGWMSKGVACGKGFLGDCQSGSVFSHHQWPVTGSVSERQCSQISAPSRGAVSIDLGTEWALMRAKELNDLKVVVRARVIQALAVVCPTHSAEDELASERASVCRAEQGIAGAARVDRLRRGQPIR